MKVSLNWVKKLTKVDVSVDGLVEKIGSQLGAVEEVIDLGKRYQGIVIVRVISCQKLEGSDHLNVCTIDDGGVVPGVERDEHGHVQVVCGAPNVRQDITVVWLPPGTTVPESYTKEPFVLEAREIRGQISNGMLASAKELAISDNHEGILEIGETVTPGTSFAEKYDLAGEFIIDIENKMFTHRPDCFGQLGVAREIAGILGEPFHSPEWYTDQAPKATATQNTDNFKLAVVNELPQLVPRFTAQVIRGVSVKASSMETQSFLAKLGVRPINNIVDITNAVMLQTGQPLHAYDYDKVKALSSGGSVKLVVRAPKPGEKIALLNGKEVEPRAETIMIASDQQLIGIGGVMGGSQTEVDEKTKNIILECATFDMYSIRRTAMEYGLFTDAVTRFTKGQSPLQNEHVLRFASNSIVDESPGSEAVGDIIDDNHLENQTWIHPPVSVSADFINSRLGVTLTGPEMKRLLENVEFTVETDGEKLTITAPFWRTDIEIPEDIVEEVGRLYGYDKLPLNLPRRDLTPALKNKPLELKQTIRQLLSSLGGNELLTYSFVHGKLLGQVGQDSSEAFQLSNAISPDLQYYRLSLTPSLLATVHANIKAGYDQLALYELGKAHHKNTYDTDGLPKEVDALALVFGTSERSTNQVAGAPYYYARKYLTSLLDHFGMNLTVHFETLAVADLHDNPWLEQIVAPYEPKRSAILRDAQGVVWGVVGEFKASVRKALKLPRYIAGFEVDTLLFLQSASQKLYTQLPKFPRVEQDICLKVPAATTYQQVFQVIWQYLNQHGIEKTYFTIEAIDIYQRDDDREHKQITFRLSIASYEKTLTDAEVASLLDKVAAAAKDKLHAERV